jgi:hypothetical protein
MLINCYYKLQKSEKTVKIDEKPSLLLKKCYSKQLLELTR